MRDQIIAALEAYRIERGSGVSEPLRAVDVMGIADAVLGAITQGRAGDIGPAIQRVEAVSLGGVVLDVYGAESFAHPTYTFRGDLRAILARVRQSTSALATALVGFNASAEGFNGECAYEGLEPDRSGRCQDPVELGDPSHAFVIRALERHLAAAGIVDGPQ